MRRTGARRWIAVLVLGLTVGLAGCEEESEDDVDSVEHNILFAA